MYFFESDQRTHLAIWLFIYLYNGFPEEDHLEQIILFKIPEYFYPTTKSILIFMEIQIKSEELGEVYCDKEMISLLQTIKYKYK